MNKRLLIVFVLGFSSGLPLSLISSTLQAWFADAGMSVMATGALSLVSLPYVYRVIWAPLLDRYSILPRLGKRRGWIFLMQGLLLVGFNFMAWLSPTTHPLSMAVLALILAIFSSTQDACIDAHRTESLPKNEHAMGAFLAVFGYRMALLVSGGLALVMAANLGWAVTYRSMGFLMTLGMVATIISPEKSLPMPKHMTLKDFLIGPLNDLFARKNVVALLVFIFMYKLGEAFTTTTSGIVMPFFIQGLGIPLQTIGYVNKVLGVLSILGGGFIAGLLMLRWTLYQSLFVFGLVQAATNCLFIALAMVGKNFTLFALAVISDNFAAGMGSTAIVALFMHLVDKRFTATQFSIFVAFATLPRVLSGPFAALVQSWVGWVGLYELSFILALGYVPFLIMIRHHTEVSSTPPKIIFG